MGGSRAEHRALVHEGGNRGHHAFPINRGSITRSLRRDGDGGARHHRPRASVEPHCTARALLKKRRARSAATA
jgi:hypothetical protein